MVQEAMHREFRAAAKRANKASARDEPIESFAITPAMMQWYAVLEVSVCKGKFEAGKKGAVLQAMKVCANQRLVMPDWLAAAYQNAYESVRRGEKRSWDDVFGRPHKKGKRLNASSRDRSISLSVAREVMSRAETQPIDDELFAAVGKQFGIGTTKVKEHYAEWKHLLQAEAARAGRVAGKAERRKSTSRKLKKRGVT